MTFSCLMIALLVFSCKYARAIDEDEVVEDPDGIYADNKERLKEGIVAITTTTNTLKEQKVVLQGVSKAISPLISGIGIIAPLLGVAGGFLTLLLAFVPKEDSDELKGIKAGFSEVNRNLDKINGKLDDFETLITFQTQRSSFIKLEHNILNGFEKMEDFYQELIDTECIESEKCPIVRKKKGVALKYLDAFQKVDPSLRSILRASINEDTLFGEPFLDLLKDTFQCEVGKLTEFVEIVVHLASKAQQVKMVTEKLTGSSLSSAQSVKRHLKSVYDLRNYYYTKKNECFEKRNHYYSKDIKDRKYQSEFFNIEHASRALSVSLEKKYPWLRWNVVSYKADHYENGRNIIDIFDYSASHWSLNFPSDKQTKRYIFVAPVDPMGDYTFKRMDKVKKIIDGMKNEKVIYNCFEDKRECVSKIKDRLKEINYIQSIIVVNEDIKPFTISKKDHSYIDSIFEFQSTDYKKGRFQKFYPNDFDTIKLRVIVMLNSVEMDNDDCTKDCSDHSKCVRLPFSGTSECQCNTNFDGEECKGNTQAYLVSSLEKMADVTSKIPNLVDIYYNLEDLKKEINGMGQILNALKDKSGTKTKKKLKKN